MNWLPALFSPPEGEGESRRLYCLRLSLVFLFFLLPNIAEAALPFNYSIFARIPVQHDGRIEPLDSFARAFLIQFSGRSSFDGQGADAWLAELLLDPDHAYQRDVFNVANPFVRDAIGLPRRNGHLYSFAEISRAMADHKDMIDTLIPVKDTQSLDPSQQQLMALYKNMLWYFELSRSLSMALPVFELKEKDLAGIIGVPDDRSFTYMEMLQHLPAYLKVMKPRLKDALRSPDRQEGELLQIGLVLQHMEVDKQTRILRIVPPQWNSAGENWLSPWETLQDGMGSPQSAALLQDWAALAVSYRQGDTPGWNKGVGILYNAVVAMAGPNVQTRKLKAENFYNRAAFFEASLGFYLAALLLLIASFILPSPSSPGGWRWRFPFLLLSCGVLLHVAGLALRVYIMGRPPVATLYESILFVGLIVVAGALLLEGRTRQGNAMLVAALAGVTLQFIGLRYAVDGDTMGPLVAVLNTNFWLATHVVAVTTGYGCCLVTGLLGHLYLLQKLLRPQDHVKLLTTERMITSAALVALLFASLGTILGGIWADQSWGRFWGWDPKENGALLIVLWLLWLLHGKLSGMLKGASFAAGAAMAVIAVALSWFGVNLLNVGLHSYGFTSDIALNLGLFVGAELLLVGGCLFLLKRRAGQAI
jgi:ABC-type transport system involved in cytochrome c biogenesis permease subunit